MRTIRSIALRFFGLFRSRRTDADFSAELESHIALHTDDGIRAGLSPKEARRQALIRLGGAEQTRQAHRERRTLPWLESLVRDFTYGLRTLGKHRVVTAIAILSIGLGIGANATIFSMVSRFVLRPAPVGDPSTLLTLKTMHDGDECCNDFPLPIFNDVRDRTKSFSGIAAYDELLPASIGGSGEPERVWGQAVSANFFDVLELPMMVGRGAGNGGAAGVAAGHGAHGHRVGAWMARCMDAFETRFELPLRHSTARRIHLRDCAAAAGDDRACSLLGSRTPRRIGRSHAGAAHGVACTASSRMLNSG
jgi:hypothetical protein